MLELAPAPEPARVPGVDRAGLHDDWGAAGGDLAGPTPQGTAAGA